MNEKTAEAGAYLARYKRVRILVALLYLALCAAMLFLDLPLVAVLIAATAFLLPRRMFRFCVMGALLDRLDGELFAEIVREGRIYVPSGLYQIAAEYYTGNYPNVIGLCEERLSDRRAHRRYGYYYLTHLANVAFLLGDEEALSEVIGRYRLALSSSRTPRRIARRFRRLRFYSDYLEGNVAACEGYLARRRRIQLDEVECFYLAARLALKAGDAPRAARLFASVRGVATRLPYGLLAEEGLKAAESGSDYPVSKTLPAAEIAATEPPRFRKVFAIVRPILMGILALLLAFYCVLHIGLAIVEREDARETAAYYERVRLLVEEDYDGVRIAEILRPTKDGETVDEIFLAHTESGVLLGSLYVYRGEEELHYEVLHEIETLRADMQYWFSSKCVVTDYVLTCVIYTADTEAPDEYLYHVRTEASGIPVYFYIKKIAPIETIS